MQYSHKTEQSDSGDDGGVKKAIIGKRQFIRERKGKT